jgi:hypothetical protein
VSGQSVAPCADPRCGAALARRFAVEHALVCTLTRLGSEHVAVLTCVDTHGNIVWTHRANARRPEDLSDIAARFGEAAASGNLPKAASTRRRRSDRTAAGGRDSTSTRRSTLSQGPRFGSVHPMGDSYAGIDQMMSFAWVWRHQTPTFGVEAVPVLGYTWGGSLSEDGCEAREWSILDLFVHWAPIPSDFAPVVGAGIGLHGVRLQRQTATGPITHNALDVTLSTGVGLILFRTYDFQVALDTRYHLTLDRMSSIDGKGAHGLSFCFGLQRR